MPRFSVSFKRKSAADDLDHVPITAPEQPSFRVIERHEVARGRSFDGGARLARASRPAAPKQASASASAKSSTTTATTTATANSHLLDLRAEDNMFADLKANRGSGVSNTTNATSTDNSSRHSNASTAPSSTDLGGAAGPDDAHQQAKHPPQEPPSRGGSKSSFLDRATRTFFFGGQKKHTIPPPKESRVPDLPPALTLQAAAAVAAAAADSESRSRGMTASIASTATPTKPDSPDFDLGGDFGSMFSSTAFDKRASMATLRIDDGVEPRSLTAVRRVAPAAPQSPDAATPAEPLLGRRSNSPGRGDASPSAYHDALPPPAVPRHQAPGSFKRASRTSDIVEDEDAKLLRESFTAMKMLSGERPSGAHAHRYRRDEDSFMASPDNDDNMFEGSMSRFPRAVHRHMARAPKLPQSNNKVMTPAEFEQYRQDKERQGSTDQAADALANNSSNNHDDGDDDEINYDDDDDELEKSKQQVKQRRKQEAHMAVYRQQMMKVTGEAASTPLPRNSNSCSGLLPSLSAPQLSLMQQPTPDAAAAAAVGVADDEDEDEDVPLGILQAHGFPSKNRPPTRLGRAGSSPNLWASMLGPPAGRPASVSGETPPSNVAARSQSTLPAFARNLPQDPFVGASIARPAVRESLSFGDAGQLGQVQGPLPPGGLVGVIVNEERTRALRRGSPTIDSHRLGAAALGGPLGGPGFDPVAGIPHHMMYSSNTAAGMPGMAHMAPPPPPQMLTPSDQVQIQMSQQMQQFMQMQMNFMQMMATNRAGGGLPMQPPMQPPMHAPYGAGFPGSASAADLSSRHSFVGESPVMEPRRMDHGMRTMSMVQPSSSSFMMPPLPPPQLPPQHGAPSIRGSFAGYAPSIAPSERSNIGLPGRYRPVSQAPPPPAHGHVRASTMSGGLSGWDDDKRKSMVQLVSKADDGSDDEEQGWEAMRAKREKKRSLWRGKKSFSSELAL